MTDNLFEHNETLSALAPTEAPYGVSPSPRAAPALSIMYVIPYLLFIVFSAGMIFASRLFRCYDKYCRRGNSRSNNEEDSVDDEEYRPREIFRSYHSSSTDDYYDVGEATVVALGMRDRIRLYRRTFDKNKHFHVLTSKNFQCPDDSSDTDENDEETIRCSMSDAVDIESTCALHESDDDIDSVGGTDSEDPRCIYLPMASSTPLDPDLETNNYSTPQKGEATTKKDPDAIYSSHTCQTIETATTVSTTNESICSSPLTKVTGTCIICFEKFRIGETVVWSDDTTACRHVFHEDCMVTNLATHSKRIKRPLGGHEMNQQSAISYSYAENPCPICRRKFCTVSHDDLVMAVLLKSVAVALGEEEEDLSIQNGGEAPPVANSERSQRIVATSYALASATMGIDSMANISSHGDSLDLTNLSYPD